MAVTLARGRKEGIEIFIDMEGYIKLPKGVFYDPSFQGEKYSRREAFLDLILMANLEPSDMQFRGETIHVGRGELSCSIRSFAAKWGWSVGKVHSVFKEFENEHKIERRTEHSICLISIVSYGDFIGAMNSSMNTQRENAPLCPTLDSPSSLSPATPITSSPLIPPIIPQKEKEISSLGSDFSEDVKRLYSLYPSKDPMTNRQLGKSSKDKTRLLKLLKTHSPEKLEKIIKRYVADCVKDGTYMKNFSTFLNNLPDYEEDAPAGKVAPDQGRVFSPEEFVASLKERERIEHERERENTI